MGIHHCVNVVTHRADWANGVLLRAVAIPGEPEWVAAGPALLARRFGDFQESCHSWAATQAACINVNSRVSSFSSGGLLIHTSSGWRQQRVLRLQRVGLAWRAAS